MKSFASRLPSSSVQKYVPPAKSTAKYTENRSDASAYAFEDERPKKRGRPAKRPNPNVDDLNYTMSRNFYNFDDPSYGGMVSTLEPGRQNTPVARVTKAPKGPKSFLSSAGTRPTSMAYVPPKQPKSRSAKTTPEKPLTKRAQNFLAKPSQRYDPLPKLPKLSSDFVNHFS